MRILVVEDSERINRALCTALGNTGYAVDACTDGEEGLGLALSNEYDAIVLDIMLPSRDGLSVVRELRANGRTVHILLLTARDAIADRVRGFRSGADDYLVKPFALDELLARVDALCRRAYGSKHPDLRIGNLAIDTVARRVSCAGEPIELTAREYLLLEYLARRAGQIVSRSEIEEHIYGREAELVSNTVDSAVCGLRKKLGPEPLIHTRRGFGYVLRPGAPTSAR